MSPTVQPGATTTRLTFVRHGQSPSNLRTLLDTAAPGPSLTELGRAQAAAVAQELAGRADLLMSSPLTRAYETAQAVSRATGLPILLRDSLREVLAGELEMRNDADALVVYRSTFLEWSRGELDRRMPGGEDGHEVMARVDRAVAEAVATGARQPVLVAHGALIRAWTGCRAADLDGFHDDPRLANTGVVVLRRDQDGPWLLESWEGSTAEALEPYTRRSDPDAVLAALSRLDQPLPDAPTP